MKASLCFLILALFQNCYGTPTLGEVSDIASAAGAGDSDCDGGHGGSHGGFPGVPGGPSLPGHGGPGIPGSSGVPGSVGFPGVPGLPDGAGLGALPMPGDSGAGALCGVHDDPDCSPITGYLFAQPAKVAPGGAGTIALTSIQVAIVDKCKSEIVHGAEAAVEAASHGDIDKCSQIILNTCDKAAVRSAQLIDSFTPGLGYAALQAYAAVSKAAHIAAKAVSKTAVGVTGGEGSFLGGSVV